jgi:hypothetical protein
MRECDKNVNWIEVVLVLVGGRWTSSMSSQWWTPNRGTDVDMTRRRRYLGRVTEIRLGDEDEIDDGGWLEYVAGLGTQGGTSLTIDHFFLYLYLYLVSLTILEWVVSYREKGGYDRWVKIWEPDIFTLMAVSGLK